MQHSQSGILVIVLLTDIVYNLTSSVKTQQGQTIMGGFTIGEKNQKELLNIARNSISAYLKTGKIPKITVMEKELLEPAAVFVTLTENGQLRGCIGTTAAEQPLYQAVSQLAISAAVEDNRFRPLTQSELKDIKIEISVLSPLTKVRSAEEIMPGYHGVVVKKGNRSGLLLPQVWEQLPDKKSFMDELCSQKAGLAPNAWQANDTDLYTFTVFAFKE
jgi:AmmeMemoRadiSam system protein A